MQSKERNSSISLNSGNLAKQEIQIPVPWGHISGVWWGSKTKQPVLALHGWQDNAGTWDKLSPYLLPEISILAIDLPGHGLSSHYPPGQMYYLFWDGVYVVRRIVNYFKWQKVTILGHSLGGAIGFLYAGCFPNDIDKLISIDIVSPTILEPPYQVNKAGENIDKILKYEKLTEDNIPCYDYEEMINIVENAYKGSVTRDSCKILMKRGMSPSPGGDGYYFARDVRLKAAGLGFLSFELIMEFARNIKCFVLNIKGKPGMSFQKPQYYHTVLDELKKNTSVEFHEVNGTHHLHLNNPERIKDIVKTFLLRDVSNESRSNFPTVDDVDCVI
ncbi:valacyclovir hydrolase, putative [Pediculus humanus corporis]|uniref:Valacyclovir hydrolase, putative n=1 Tax=Pediculus humanus subsp. corporis TaxID=121224 RepID=E0VGA1_PEDHC|nr:valacyclovir hydrolase, putative [Pediculus humanus corporis]EEB12407.1 valacyclovir hydrolase, putative [Pediculus humanus corporis]